MDVSRMMRSVLGEVSQAETRVLELKPGQVVRGVVLKLNADNEAIVNVNGVAVRAQLGSPVGVGQAALLQIQPDSGSGLVLMKPLNVSAMEMAAESLVDVLRNMGLRDTPLNRAIVRVLHDEGVPLTRETSTSVEAVLKQLSPSGEPEPWIRAAATAVNRGLPLGADTVRGLHAVMTGPALPELLQALETSAREAAAAPETQPGVKQAAERLLGLLQRADALLVQALQPQAAAEEGGARTAPSGTGAAAQGAPQPAAGGGPAGAAAPAAATTPQTGVPTEARAAAGSATPAPPADRAAIGAAPGAAAAPLSAPASQGAAAGGSVSEPQAPPAGSQAAARGASESAPPSAEQASQAKPSASVRPEERPPLLAFFKLLGLDVEREWLRASAMPTNTRDVPAAGASLEPSVGPAEEKPGPNPGVERALRASKELPQPGALIPERFAAAERTSSPLDTLKSALSVLAASDDVPPALKEAAQSMLGHVAGQQLLMTGDRAAPFAHVAMFIPLRGKEGGEGNASVHIHTRRGKRGELDAENCRLWFQLDLATLGETWIDVQVTNRVIGLHLWNDHPAAGELLQSSKFGMEAVLKDMGYILLSFRHSPKPEPTPADGGGSGDNGKNVQLSASYAPKSYKGVDMRI